MSWRVLHCSVQEPAGAHTQHHEAEDGGRPFCPALHLGSPHQAAPCQVPAISEQQYHCSELLTAQGALQACQGLKRDVPCSALGAGTKEVPWEGRVGTEKEADLRSPPSGWPARPVVTSSCPHLT